MSKHKKQRSNKPAIREDKSALAEINQGRQQIAVAASYHSGPLPDPATLERYDLLVPGTAERIIRMAEEQSAHRRELEKIVIKSRSRDSLLGIIAAFLIAIGTVVAGTFVIIKGSTWGGTILGSAGLVGLVGVFIYGTRSARKEREAKEKEF